MGLYLAFFTSAPLWPAPLAVVVMEMGGQVWELLGAVAVVFILPAEIGHYEVGPHERGDL